jgi:OOP family OmpA-OmpF porin
MFKKIITISLFSISALAMMTAHAAIPSEATTQTKKQNTKKHSKLAHTTPLAKSKPAPIAKVSTPKNDAPFSQTTLSLESESGLPEGLYVGGQVGYADTHMGARLNPISNNLSNNGLAGRLAIGYKLNQNFAIEAGYLQLQDTKLSLKSSSHTISNEQNAIDLVGKSTFPLTHNVNLYGKLGVAYLTTQLEERYTLSGVPVTENLNSEAGVAKHKWAPEVAIGMGYDVTKNVSVETSFTHIQPLGNNRPGNINFLAVGMGYNFG